MDRVGWRGSSRPSAEKSSQKSSSAVPHRPPDQARRRVTPPAAGVASAIVPQAACDGSTPSDDSRTPSSPAPERAVLRLRRAPVGCGSPFQSFCTTDPSMPTKLGRFADAAAATCRLPRLRSVTTNDASGMPLASASAGTKGFQARSSTSSGTSGSSSITRAKGYAVAKRAARNRGRCSLGVTAPWLPCRPATGLGPSSSRHTGSPPSGCANRARKGPTVPALPSRGTNPFAGRFMISQSRRSPRPPSDTVPVPMPPMGIAMRSSEVSSYTRNEGQSTSSSTGLSRASRWAASVSTAGALSAANPPRPRPVIFTKLRRSTSVPQSSPSQHRSFLRRGWSSMGVDDSATPRMTMACLGPQRDRRRCRPVSP